MKMQLGSGDLFVNGEWVGRAVSMEMDVVLPNYNYEALTPEPWPDCVIVDVLDADVIGE